MAEYKIFFKKSVWKDLESIPKNNLKRILKSIKSLGKDPRPPGCRKLSGQERYRLRHGQYRIIYSIQDDELTIWVVKVLQGFKADKDFKAAESFLSALPFRPMGGYIVAVQSAQNYRKLRKAGITVRKTIDVVIATFCMAEDLTLLHDDRDFEPISSCLPLKTISSR